MDNDYRAYRSSGGEQDDIAFALRIALSRYLAGIHQVHESTVPHLRRDLRRRDRERRNNLLTDLRTQGGPGPRILLIFPIAEMLGVFANTLMVEMGVVNANRRGEVA